MTPHAQPDITNGRMTRTAFTVFLLMSDRSSFSIIFSGSKISHAHNKYVECIVACYLYYTFYTQPEQNLMRSRPLQIKFLC